MKPLIPNDMIEPFWYFHAMKRPAQWIHNKINAKATFAEYKKGWSGPCKVEQSGMDCDGMQYAGYIMHCEPNFYAFDKMIDREYESADGPMYFRLITDEEANQMRRRSRDRAMEAFEDGHTSTLYMGTI